VPASVLGAADGEEGAGDAVGKVDALAGRLPGVLDGADAGVLGSGAAVHAARTSA
jgi:hypothetical protein